MAELGFELQPVWPQVQGLLHQAKLPLVLQRPAERCLSPDSWQFDSEICFDVRWLWNLKEKKIWLALYALFHSQLVMGVWKHSRVWNNSGRPCCKLGKSVVRNRCRWMQPGEILGPQDTKKPRIWGKLPVVVGRKSYHLPSHFLCSFEAWPQELTPRGRGIECPLSSSLLMSTCKSRTC